MPWDSPGIFQFLSLVLLGSGLLGLVSRRTLLGMLLAVELILNGAGLNLVLADRFFHPASPQGEVFTLFIMGVAAAEAAIALGIILLLSRRRGTIGEEGLRGLRG